MTTQLVITGLFALVLIGSFDSLESMIETLSEFEVPQFEID
jgi:hypothetical protein